MAVLCSHVFVMPDKFGETVVLNTELVSGIFKNAADSVVIGTVGNN